MQTRHGSLRAFLVLANEHHQARLKQRLVCLLEITKDHLFEPFVQRFSMGRAKRDSHKACPPPQGHICRFAIASVALGGWRQVSKKTNL